VPSKSKKITTTPVTTCLKLLRSGIGELGSASELNTIESSMDAFSDFTELDRLKHFGAGLRCMAWLLGREGEGLSDSSPLSSLLSISPTDLC